MSYAVIWRYTPTEGGAKVLIGHPGTFCDSDAEAKEEGRRILADGQIDNADRRALMPLVVVEVNSDMGEDIQDRCEEVEIGTELLFYDLDDYGRWNKQPWWPHE